MNEKNKHGTTRANFWRENLSVARTSPFIHGRYVNTGIFLKIHLMCEIALICLLCCRSSWNS